MRSNVLTKVFTAALVNPCPSPSTLSQLFWYWQEHHIHNSSINYVLHLYIISRLSIYLSSIYFISSYLYFLPLCIRLNLFYLNYHFLFISFCLSLFWISCFFLFFCFFLSFFLNYSFYFHHFLPSLSLSLSRSLSLAISPYFLFIIFSSFFFLYPHRFFLTLSCFDFYSLHYTPRWRSSF